MSKTKRAFLVTAKIASIIFFPVKFLLYCFGFLLVGAMGGIRTEKDLDELREFLFS